MLSRKFGIELEFSRPLMNMMYHEREKNMRWTTLHDTVRRLTQDGDLLPGWKFMVDTSCGGEIVSPPISDMANGFRDITTICNEVIKMSVQAGQPAADAECGLHLHFDAANLKPRTVGHIFSLLYKYEPIIFSIYTMRNPRYCSPITVNMAIMPKVRTWTEVRDVWYRPTNNVLQPNRQYTIDFINSNEQGEHHDGTRYHGFNIHCYWRQKTIEFRYGKGTFDAVKIYAFHELCSAIINKAVKMRSSESFEQQLKYDLLYEKTVNGYKFRDSFNKMCRDLGLSRFTKYVLWKMAKSNNPKLVEKNPKNKKTFVCNSNKDKFIFSTLEGSFTADGKIVTNAGIGSTKKQIISATISLDGEVFVLKPQNNVSIETEIVVPESIIEKIKNRKVSKTGDAWVEFIG